MSTVRSREDDLSPARFALLLKLGRMKSARLSTAEKKLASSLMFKGYVDQVGDKYAISFVGLTALSCQLEHESEDVTERIQEAMSYDLE